MSAWRLEIFEELGSTSDECAARARAGAPGGLAILALRQTAGRGSRGRAWQAPEGNLNLSVMLRPNRPAAEAGMFALLAGIAVAEALGAVQTTLKWPNDILLNSAKLAGILIDAAPQANTLDWLVIGIGVNLREAPRIAGRQTTCLAAHGIALAPQTLAAHILARLTHWQEQPAAAIRDAWLARAHPLGTPLTVQTGTVHLHGSFAGLSPAGELLLARENRIEPVSTGEILLGAS